MARKSDPARIYVARRDAIASRLTGSGMPPDDTERWLAAWEARVPLGGLDANHRDLWQTGGDWIESERPVKRWGDRRCNDDGAVTSSR
jgi:hypothetical protein